MHFRGLYTVRVLLAALGGLPLALWGPAAHAQTVPVAHFQRVAGGRITLDGKLDEPAWSWAPALTDFYEGFRGDNAASRAAPTTFAPMCGA